MLCKKSGTPLPDGATSCPDCGASAVRSAALQPSKVKPVLMAIAGCLVVILVVISILSVLYNNPEPIAKKYVKAWFKGNINACLQCSVLNKKVLEERFQDQAEKSDMSLEEYYEKAGKDAEYDIVTRDLNDLVKAESKRQKENMKSLYGNYRVSVKVSDAKKMTKNNLKKLRGSIKKAYKKYITISEIKEAYEINVKYEIKGTSEKKEGIKKVTVLKYGMTWRVSPFNLEDSANADTDSINRDLDETEEDTKEDGLDEYERTDDYDAVK